MKKVFACLKRYFFEILFVCVSVLTIALAINGALCYTGWLSAGVILLAAFLQLIFGTCIQQSSNAKSVLRVPVTVWFVYFAIFLTVVFLTSFASSNLHGELTVALILLFDSLSLRRRFFGKEKSFDKTSDLKK